MSILALS